MKKPVAYAFTAIGYIVFIVSAINSTSFFFKDKPDTIFAPMVMLGLFVLSAAVMGFLFLSEPLTLYLDRQKKEALVFFGKIVGFFACFVIILGILLLIF